MAQAQAKRFWFESRWFAPGVFVAALLLICGAAWVWLEYYEQQKAAEIERLTKHYEKEIRQQMEAVETLRKQEQEQRQAPPPSP